MAGIVEPDSQEVQRNECSFEWDENSQLYFHASSGFYHDPSAGWYYSSRDGLYYKFENGNYVLLESDKGDEPEAYQCTGTVPDEPTLDEPCSISSHEPDNPTPTSEWLEDTLIDLYLSGYSNPAMNAADDVRMPVETDDRDNFKMSDDGNTDAHGLEEGQWIPDDCVTDSNESVLDEGASWDEENWRAQYGQVIKSGEETVPDIPVVDLWDWAMVTGSKKGRKSQVARLVGRLVRRSTKLHPSMPSGGGLLKTAPIREVLLDLVRVSSGQVYKLRSPSARYLASLSTYDSSNPTKDWGFPELSVDRKIIPLSKPSGNCELKAADGIHVRKDLPVLADELSISEKHKSHAYRDRAAERRTLHGGFGVGPGQKKIVFGDAGLPSSPDSACTEEAAAEALHMSFGVGSYARKILESMGWKEGEALGSTAKGLTEPLQAVGNKGNAGLGWPQGRTKHC